MNILLNSLVKEANDSNINDQDENSGFEGDKTKVNRLGTKQM